MVGRGEGGWRAEKAENEATIKDTRVRATPACVCAHL